MMDYKHYYDRSFVRLKELYPGDEQWEIREVEMTEQGVIWLVQKVGAFRINRILVFALFEGKIGVSELSRLKQLESKLKGPCVQLNHCIVLFPENQVLVEIPSEFQVMSYPC